METSSFPTERYLDAVVRFLNIIKYNDTNYTREERVRNLHYVYTRTALHFTQPKQQRLIKASPESLQAVIQTIVRMVVYGWVCVDPKVMADLSIYYTYLLILDDSEDNPDAAMGSFYQDLLAGRSQQHPWWQMVNEQFPTVLSHYGPYCSLNMVRSTIDFFQGCWIENGGFRGFPGSYDFPGVLRRLNGLGQSVGASFFPKAQFDERALFTEITSVIANMENWVPFANDLFSFYKEFDASHDQTSLVNNYVQCNRISLAEALDKLAGDLARCSEQIVGVFADKDPAIVTTLSAFCQGYVTWHLSDPRYRLRELSDRAAGDAESSSAAREFRRYQAASDRVGAVDPEQWAYPSVAELAERNRAAEGT